MSRYITRTATADDVDRMTDIYNSNPVFLTHHLGTVDVTRAFVEGELATMRTMGFTTEIITDSYSDRVVGFCDYGLAEGAYLSLLMLNGNVRLQGVGRCVYQMLEEKFAALGQAWVRIDVVDCYEGSPIGFWEKQGFVTVDETELNWGGRLSHAVVMKKSLL